MHISSTLLPVLTASAYCAVLRQSGVVDTTCNNACQASFEKAFKSESSQWVDLISNSDEPSTGFYRTPLDFSSAQKGDLLKWQDIPSQNASSNWTVPASMSLSRYLYVTEDIDGKPLPASGFVLLPYAADRNSKSSPLRTVVWTHGTAGRGRQCAPSNHKGLYYAWEGVFRLAQAGYAVIAPDYAGQGSDIPQGFMYEAGYLHASDVAYGLIAARKRIGHLISNEWVVVGHSEGGMTAWRTNERLAMTGPKDTPLLAAGKFLGAVAMAPALRPLDLIPEAFRRAAGGPVGDVVSIFFLQSLIKLFPELGKIEDYVSDIVASRIPLADKACLASGVALFSNLTEPELYKNLTWLQHPSVIDWQTRYNGAGPHALASPMLIVQGEADILTYPENTVADFDRTCQQFPDSDIHYLSYPGLDHGAVLIPSPSRYVPWINDQFDGKPVTQGCSFEKISPLTDRYSKVQPPWQAVVH